MLPLPPRVSSRRIRREETPACVRQSPDGDTTVGRGWTRALNHHDISRMDGPHFKGAPVTCFTRCHKHSEAAAAIATALSGLPADKGRRMQDATRHHRWEVVSFTTTEHTATRLRLGPIFFRCQTLTVHLKDHWSTERQHRCRASLHNW